MANFTPQEIEQFLQEFFNVVGARQYTGARYVPIFGRKDESSIEWNNTKPYEPLTIVLYQGNSYTSRQYVPVGVDIFNTDYWANTGNYNAQVEQYKNNVDLYRDEVDEIVSRLDADIYLKDYDYGLTQENFATNFLSFLAEASSQDKIALLTRSYQVYTNIVVRLDKVSIESAPNIILEGAGQIDFRDVTNLYCVNLVHSCDILFNYYGAEELTEQSKRNVYLVNCINVGNVSRINDKLYIATAIPENGYVGESARTKNDYKTYPLEILNHSGYNAVMIINKSLDSEGNITNGGSDNSAVGITDRVPGVAAPTILVDGGIRHLLRYISTYTEPTRNYLLDISADGRIAIGCNSDASDADIPNIAALKICYPNPIISLKDKNANHTFDFKFYGQNIHLEFDGNNILSIKNGRIVLSDSSNISSDIVALSGTNISSVSGGYTYIGRSVTISAKFTVANVTGEILPADSLPRPQEGNDHILTCYNSTTGTLIPCVVAGAGALYFPNSGTNLHTDDVILISGTYNRKFD